MTLLNRALGRVFDAVSGAFMAWPPLLLLALVALVTAIVMLLVLRATSDPRRIEAAKKRITAGLFEIRLYNDDPRAVMRAQADILRHNLAYLRHSAVPMLWTLVPLVLLTAQLQAVYGWQPFATGSHFLVAATLRPGAAANAAARPDVTLRAPAGLRVETADLWVPSRSEVIWRVRAEAPGTYAVELATGAETCAKQVRVAGEPVRLSPIRRQSGLVHQILYPVESPLPAASPVERITVNYPPGQVSVFGWHLPWMVVFFGLVVVFVLALKSRFGVAL